MKYCPQCQDFKSEEDFYKNRSKKDGLTSYCKICDSKRTKKHRQEHPDYYKQAYKNFISEHPGYNTKKFYEWLEKPGNRKKYNDYQKYYNKHKRV